MTKMLLTVALLCASLSLQGIGSAHASSNASQPDQVIQWNRTLLQILQTPSAQPATIHPTRSMAIVHLAIYDAVNAIRGGHAPYLVLLTPPNFKQPVFTNWPDVRPFALETGDQFRPPPPPAVTSPRYTTDFDEIKSLGEIKSTTRSADQTDIGRFWGAAPVQNEWNQIAQTAGMSFDNSLGQNARMFALLDTSLADGVIALYDSKYAYHRWRPVTAVQAADDDGNPDTTGDPNWTPLAVTALDPSYAGAHAEISQSAAAILRDFFGTDRVDFSLTNPGLPGIVRSFQSFSQASDEAAASRIYAGQHFRYDEDAGQALGDEVGDFVFDNILGPVPHGR